MKFRENQAGFKQIIILRTSTAERSWRTQTDYVQGVVDDLTKWLAVYTANWVIHCRRTIEDLRQISRLVGKREEDGEKVEEEEEMIGKRRTI